LLFFISPDKLTDEQFCRFLNIIRNFLVKIPVLSLESNKEPVDEDEMCMSEEIDMESQVLGELVNMFDSAEFTNRIELLLNHFSRQQDSYQQFNQPLLASFCMSLAYIADFILVNSRIKTHQSL
jgi:hypothetical protein